MITKDEAFTIKDDSDLSFLTHRFLNGPTFALGFVFENDELYTRFFESVGISVDEFQKKYYYFNKEKNIHISEHERGFVWISTMGLVATSRVTKNNFVNAFLAQVPTLMHLLEESIKICDNEDVYDIESYAYEQVEQLTLSLFHNLVFFSEVLLKSYISLQGEKVPHTHRLKTLLKQTKEIIYKKKHDNTLFHAYIFPIIEDEVLHISNIPGEFKEQYVKYDDNTHDTTVIAFSSEILAQIRDFVRISEDIISGMYYEPKQNLYLKQGLYERLINKCETTEAKSAVEKVYGFLVEQKNKA